MRWFTEFVRDQHPVCNSVPHVYRTVGCRRFVSNKWSLFYLISSWICAEQRVVCSQNNGLTDAIYSFLTVIRSRKTSMMIINGLIYVTSGNVLNISIPVLKFVAKFFVDDVIINNQEVICTSVRTFSLYSLWIRRVNYEIFTMREICNVSEITKGNILYIVKTGWHRQSFEVPICLLFQCLHVGDFVSWFWKSKQQGLSVQYVMPPHLLLIFFLLFGGNWYFHTLLIMAGNFTCRYAVHCMYNPAWLRWSECGLIWHFHFLYPSSLVVYL